MADTLSMDTAVNFIVQHGGSVRLIGDDQQLAAIGAGGVLRDIQAIHGADRLTEAHRFQDPAEAAASLTLRDGRAAALGFYLDHQRVHVGTPPPRPSSCSLRDRLIATAASTRPCSPPPATSSLDVRHAQHGRTVTLPAHYVRTVTELGYATTVHGAQGVTVDTMHGLATGAESRQQLYTMLTRGRAANHVYLAVGDGDPHIILRPDHIHVHTATELLKQILARDATPPSATTLQREQHDPAILLGHATARYLDRPPRRGRTPRRTSNDHQPRS
jgi:hypothetical protein